MSRTTILAIVFAASCGSKDNSADTDQASKELREAQTALRAKQDSVGANTDNIARSKHEIVVEQQRLADQQSMLDRNRELLGSAQGTLVQARASYAAAVKERFAKLDATLAGLATKTDAASTDARAGLTARRDLLAVRLGTMPTGADPSWSAYTKDVDTTFDAIERDLRAATQ